MHTCGLLHPDSADPQKMTDNLKVIDPKPIFEILCLSRMFEKKSPQFPPKMSASIALGFSCLSWGHKCINLRLVEHYLRGQQNVENQVLLYLLKFFIICSIVNIKDYMNYTFGQVEVYYKQLSK